MAKYSALDIADFFVELANSIPHDSIDNLKVNKLCYYAQGWSIARLGYPLFDEQIEAWRFGPLIPSVYNAYKAYGSQPIMDAVSKFDEARLTSDELELLTDVYVTYGKYTSKCLIDMTHVPGSPWSVVFKEMENNIIPQESMGNYFRQSEELETLRLNATPENTTSYE